MEYQSENGVSLFVFEQQDAIITLQELWVETDQADDIGQLVTVACHPSHRKVPRRAESYKSKSGEREPKASRRGYHTAIRRETITQARNKG
uniref:Uncharacterized protein n=1 Tax=Magallana gigas TaxID=29159 RepID=K1R3X9_MAGGI